MPIYENGAKETPYAIVGSLTAGRERALDFRLDSHHLAVRMPPGSLPVAAGACGVQDTPPGEAGRVASG